jgi:hypothetical protein
VQSVRKIDQWKPNLVWIITRVSSFKIVSGDAVHQPTWPLLLKIEHMVKLQILQGSHYFEIGGRSDFSFRCWQKRSERQQGEVVRVQGDLGSGFNRVIELNQKMLILTRFVMKNYFFFMSGSRKLMLNIFKNEQFSCQHHIKKSFFVTNLAKINIFRFSSITRLEQDLIRCF